MNLIERSIEVAREKDLTPDAALTFALVIIRGGKVNSDILGVDFSEWVFEHGETTWEKLEEWAAGMDMESSLIEPIVRSNCG